MKEDLRVRKTKTALRNSLVKLLKDKSLEKFSIISSLIGVFSNLFPPLRKNLFKKPLWLIFWNELV